jgi:hypothetical protein
MSRALHISLCAAALAACTGRIGDHPGEGAGGTGLAPGAGTGAVGATGTGGAGATAASCAPAAEPMIGSTPLRRLSVVEYGNTVRDLFGPGAPAPDLLPDARTTGFDNNADLLTVSPAAAERYLTAAETLAGTATANLGALSPCLATATAASEASCVDGFIRDFGRRAFRRPLVDAEVTALGGLFAGARGDGDSLAQAVAVTIAGMLQSPYFLYRTEVAQAAAGQTVARLAPFELASRLSYLLWGSMPDETLMAAAAADQLGNKELIAAQARRMLDDPRARAMVAGFDEQWLQTYRLTSIQKDAATFPDFSPAIAAAMKTETDMFVDDVVWQSGGSVMDLFTAPYTFRNKTLATFYGAGAGPTGSTFARVDLDPARAAGLLTQGGVMAAIAHAVDTDPTRRGKFVRVQLLCESIPPPPPDVNAVPTTADPGQTTRQHAISQRGSGGCGTCHQLMDRIGFAFENYDAVGRWRDTENGQAVDASGELIGTDVPGPFDGPAALGQKMAGSAEARRCAVTQWWRFAAGRPEEAADACAIASVDQAFAASGSHVRELLLAITQTDGFAYGKVQP